MMPWDAVCPRKARVFQTILNAIKRIKAIIVQRSASKVIRARCSCLPLSFLAAAANQWSPREAPALRHVTTSQDHSPTTTFSPTLARGPRHPGRRNDEAPQTLVATRPPEATTPDRTNRVPLSGAGQSWRLAPPLMPGHFSVVAESFCLPSSSGCGGEL